MTLLINFEPIPARQFPEGITTHAHQETIEGIFPVVVKRQGENLYILPIEGPGAMTKIAL